MRKIWSKPPLNIPGKPINPPDKISEIQCSYCGKKFKYPKRLVDTSTGRVSFVCPYCGKRLKG